MQTWHAGPVAGRTYPMRMIHGQALEDCRVVNVTARAQPVISTNVCMQCGAGWCMRRDEEEPINESAAIATRWIRPNWIHGGETTCQHENSNNVYICIRHLSIGPTNRALTTSSFVYTYIIIFIHLATSPIHSPSLWRSYNLHKLGGYFVLFFYNNKGW